MSHLRRLRGSLLLLPDPSKYTEEKVRSLVLFIENSHRDLVFKATIGIQSGFETEELHVI